MIDLPDEDLRVTMCRNPDAPMRAETPQNGVVLKHLPTGIVATVCRYRSPHLNMRYAKAMIRAGLAEMKWGSPE